MTTKDQAKHVSSIPPEIYEAPDCTGAPVAYAFVMLFGMLLGWIIKVYVGCWS